MSTKIVQVERIFKYGGTVLDDPDPAMSPAEVKDFYADIFPELTQAVIEGPEYSDTQAVYTFEKKVGTKGVTVNALAAGLALVDGMSDAARPSSEDMESGGLDLHRKVARALTGSEGEPLLPPSDTLGVV